MEVNMKRLVAVLGIAALTLPAMAQDHSGHGMAIDLPPICLAGTTPHEMPSMAMQMPSPAHEELMAGMDRMNTDMMAGGLAADIDVAFVCSMIPHHRGAIDMARAELAHGDDPFARELAEAIIVAQEKEIADMLAWLETQAE
jgi:uncharacterized protein (DUF305 family)